jgi:hypothetical protein
MATDVNMLSDGNLQFIRQKIYQLRSAIMYSMSNELVKIPNNIVTAIRVDDEGNLWFLSKRPAQFVSECEQNFPARLHFYRNVNDGSDINTSIAGFEKPVLIKMTMKNIEYVEPAERKRKSRVEMMIENGYKWLARTIAFPRHSKPLLAKLHR